MSEIAGRLATQAGAFMLEKPMGGRGVLLGGVPGVAAANVMIIGGGSVGRNAAASRSAWAPTSSSSMSPSTACASSRPSSGTLLDRLLLHARDRGVAPRTDLVVGAVLVAGDRAPYVIRRSQLPLMRPGTVLVDVAIDQGGCFETSRPTTHHEPTFEVDGITHYCVTNMPGAVPVTATHALANSTLPYVLALAAKGVIGAIEADPGLRPGVNVAGGVPTHPAVARSVGAEVSRSKRRSPPLSTEQPTRGIAMRTLENFIDGAFRPPADGATDPVLNPATGEEIAQAPRSSAATSTRGAGGAPRV